MTVSFASSSDIQEFPLWERMKKQRNLLSFELELTARCGQNCRHCYINLPANDPEARSKELSLRKIEQIAEQAVQLGALWCLITGGDPLVRPDFSDIYLMLKRKGLMITVFTAATLVNQSHIQLFRHYPPRTIEVTVYGTTQQTYEKVTRCPGSFQHFERGLNMLLKSGIKVRLKAMALRSNLHEMDAIATFCRQHTCDFFRFDPLLHLRYDGNPVRNAEIRSERLSPEEITALEQGDTERRMSLQQNCERFIFPDKDVPGKCIECPDRHNCKEYERITRLFHCGTGNGSCNIGYDGTFRLCSSLWAPETTCNLRTTSLINAWRKQVPRVRAMYSQRRKQLESCAVCSIVNLCNWCPAHAHLETGELEGETPYFCAVAHARAAGINNKMP
jgi:radical SAM protein with 4Fe4S-binding SPASM domain